MFCGACGDLLNRPLPSRGGLDDHGRPSWWRRPFVAGGLALAVVIGIVAAVPTLSIQRTDPIDDTTIDVPDTDELQAAPAGTRPRPRVDPPEVTCTRHGVETDCVVWSRGLAAPMDGQGHSMSWPLIVGDHVLIVGDGEVEAADAATGTRLWRADTPQDSFPAGTAEGVLVVRAGSGITAMDLETGRTRWAVDTDRGVNGHVVHDDVVLTGPAPDAEAGLTARHPRTGEILWRWSSPAGWHDIDVRRLDPQRLMVSSSGQGMAVVDARTGEERSRAQGLPQGWIVDVVDDTILTLTHPDMDPSEPNPAGDPGAVVSGTDLVDGTPRWARDVRSSQAWFAVVGDMVLAPSSRHLTALDATTGDTVWEVETSSSENPAQYRPIGSWEPLQGAAVESPAVAVTVAQRDGMVRGREATTGDVLWEHDLSQTPWHAVVQGDDVVVQTNGGVHVLSATTGEEHLRVDSPELQMTGTDPFIVFDPVSGYVTRLDLSAAMAR